MLHCGVELNGGDGEELPAVATERCARKKCCVLHDWMLKMKNIIETESKDLSAACVERATKMRHEYGTAEQDGEKGKYRTHLQIGTEAKRKTAVEWRRTMCERNEHVLHVE